MGSQRWLARMTTAAARAVWPLIERYDARFERPSPKPAWAPGSLLKRRERSFPPLGWPRQTDSLCPRCVKETRSDILDGRRSLYELIDGKPGEIKADIVEENGKIVMKKTCAKHGTFTDVLSIDPAWLSRIERLYPGRDFKSPPTELRQHGTSSIQYGRGSVLTVDLTNRCNMMCDPCFMDANQVGYVHELSWDEIRKLLDDALTIQPRRQLSVQFSGGEPTLSPYFLDAIRYAREKGFFAVQCATNGLRFAEEPGFAKQAKEAGLRMAYLQFDGIGNEANAHRKIGNLYDVKLRAIEEMAAAGIDVILVVTVVNGVNNDQIGKILQYAVDNPDKITVVSFQPVSFTGRDEDIDDETRMKQRYSLSHLAYDVKAQTGITEPLRDWFPLSALGPFSDLVDQLMGERADWGSMKCGCHPNCGVGTILMVNKHTRQMVPLSQFLDVEGLLDDIGVITDAAQPRAITVAQLGVALAKRFHPEHAPEGYGFAELLKQFLSQTGARGKKIGDYESDADEFEWRVLFVAGMWFQDLFNYDFRRTEMCIIPYATQMGEISFCAYNTGVGWRNIVEKMLHNATVADWYREHGRHKVYAKGQDFPMPKFENPITSRLPGGTLKLKVVG
jgi:tetraether lipid synthase